MNFHHGSLFSGIGGFDLAAQWMGWQNIFHCELNPFGRHVLKYYWPASISYRDIRETDFHIHANTIDILSGGFPCQPYSIAGKRKGKNDDRHLWPQMLRAIKEIQPGWVVGENVFGLVNWAGGLVFDEVQADLEASGYQVFTYLLPACGVNAPHRRDRIWIVAYSNSYSHSRKERRKHEEEKGVQEQIGQENSTTRNIGRTDQYNSSGWRKVGHERFDPNSNNFSRRTETNGRWEEQIRERSGFRPCSEPLDETNRFEDVANSHHERFRQQSRNTEPAQSGQYSRAFEKIGFEHWPTQSPICSGNDGLPGRMDGITFPKWRTESIKAFGNAIVPEVVFKIFKAIENFEKL